MTKLRKDLKVYVIGMKGWVEVRVGKVPPKPHTTTVSKTIQVSERVYRRWTPDEIWPPPSDYRTVEREVVLSATTWSGGRPICSMPLRRFYAMTRLRVNHNHVMELPTRHIKRVTKMDLPEAA